jgi:hypothetical protein
MSQILYVTLLTVPVPHEPFLSVYKIIGNNLLLGKVGPDLFLKQRNINAPNLVRYESLQINSELFK